MQKCINIKIGGKAGEGIKTTGFILSKSLVNLGFSIFSYDEYPSLIRGGHNSYQVYASLIAAHSQHYFIDILIAFDEQTFKLHQAELKKDAVVLFDPDVFCPEKIPSLKTVEIPLKKLAQDSGLSKAGNMVALGAVFTLLGLPTDNLKELVGEIFSAKGKEILKGNTEAVQSGVSFIESQNQQDFSKLSLPSKSNDQIVVLGNDAMGAGALAAGLKYFASYPMTPASSLFHFLADFGEKFNVVVHHAENEITAINAIIGASAAGVRVMTATSGGGFSLMAEGLGMSGIAEVPVVVVLGMRPGPATGLPTWTGQGDLRFVIHASQDEFPRVILSPGDAFEAFELTKKAFVLAEKYQLPVIILADKYLMESHKSGPAFSKKHQNPRFGFVEEIKGDLNRYRLTESGISPRPILGQKGGASTLANSYEHGQDGYSTENSKDRIEQMQKRMKKLDSIADDLGDLPVFGPKNARVTLVGFGSTLGPVLEALKNLPDTNYLHFNYVWPFPKSALKVLKKAQNLICLESNSEGQLRGLIREYSGVEIKDFFPKFDGRPFYPEEIEEFVKKA